MFKLLKCLNKKDKLLILAIVLFIIGQVALELRMPDYMSKITILVQTEGNNINEILTNGANMLLCALGSFVFAVLTGYATSKLAALFSMKLEPICPTVHPS